MGFGDVAEPLGIEQSVTDRVPGRQTGAKLCDALHLLPEADQGKAPAHGCLREPLRHVMLARDVDRRLGLPLGRSKLPAQVVQKRDPGQGEGEAVGVREPLSEGEAGLHRAHGTVGKAEEPKGPCRIEPARHAGALRVEHEVGTMFLPACDRIVDRDALVQGCRRIGKPPKEEQRCS